MTIIKIIALVIFVISCVTIYHNTNSFEPKKRILYIIIGMVIMYGITCIICALKSDGIKTTNTAAINDTLGVIKMIFTPINAIIFLAPLGNIFGKTRDNIITTTIAVRRLLILLVFFVIIIISETNYIGSFISNLLG